MDEGTGPSRPERSVGVADTVGGASQPAWRIDIGLRRGDFSLEVALSGGRVLALVGPNGSGKSTVLRALVGAVRPERGRIELAGQVLFDHARGVDLPIEQRRVGLVPQGYRLFPHLSAWQNVAYGLRLRAAGTGGLWGLLGRAGRSGRRTRAIGLLGALGCGDLADRPATSLSGGEQQRVALARALAAEPDVLLLDEPLAALDAITRRSVRRFLVERLPQLACPVVLVTHDVRDAVALGAEVAVLERGRLVQRGSVAALRAEPASDFVAAFVEGADAGIR